MTGPVLADWLAERFGAEFAAELLAEFRAAGQARVAEAASAARRGDADTLERATHTLGSMALTVGFAELGRLCRAAETQVRASGAAGVDIPPLAAAFTLAALQALELENGPLRAAESGR